MEKGLNPRGAVISQLRKGVAPYCVLALLAGQQRYGYDLARELAASGVVAGAGSVYPLLSRLQQDGWIRSAWREPEAGVPRKYYTLTREGRAALDGFAALWPQFVTEVARILASGREPEGGHQVGR